MIKSDVTRADALRASLVGRLPVPQPVVYATVQVEIGVSEVLLDYIDELYVQYELAMFPQPMRFTKEDLVTYAKSLLQQRVASVSGGKRIISYKDGHAVPSMLSVILEMIGKCSDNATGISLEPICDSELGKVKVDVNFMKDMSLKLRTLERMGFIFATGLPRPIEGDFDFMSFAVIEGVVRHMRDDKPEAYAVAAAMLNLTGLTTFFGTAVYNSGYAPVSILSHCARELAQPRSENAKPV